ncbi:MAG: thiopurine S-methyltransferase [Zetaproteobacteria bacterium CG2_30_46_52]|nr:MAG: thiopurine S-methyltransferase [Zetaproteobacteria bacterium CG2_30_46_52]
MLDWEGMYQAEQTGWDRGQASPALAQWLASEHLADKSQRILIPGCGRGYEVIALAKLGFNVTAIDIAPSAIAALNQGLAEAGVYATTICGDIFTYDAQHKFDVVYEQTCLCAIRPDEREAYAQKLSEWLKFSGKLLFSMMQTGVQGGPPYHCELMDMRTLFDNTRWQWANQPPFVIPRGKQSERFELGFVLQHLGSK